MAELETDQEKAKHCENLLEHLKRKRQPYEAMVDNVITFVNHSRRKVQEKDTYKGQKTGVELYDGTALRAKNLLVDGMVGYLCSRSLHWFRATIRGRMKFSRSSMNMAKWSGKNIVDLPEVGRWLDDYTECGYEALNRSNFYDAIPEFVGDGASIGTAHAVIEDDTANGRAVVTVPHFRECYFDENRFGYVDTFFRVFKYTWKQMLEKFGLEKMRDCFSDFDNKFVKNPYQEEEILKAIMPRENADPKRIDKKGKPVACYYVLLGKKKLLEETGYDTHPTLTWRWRKNNDELCGRSPSWDALVEIMLAQQQGRTNIIAGQKMAEPPMVGTADLRGSVNQGPKGWTWVDDMTQAPRLLYQQGLQVPFSVELQERVDRAIRENFYVDFFLALMRATIEKVELTATQVVGMQGEQAAVLGTRVGNFESEGLDHFLERFFYIEETAGRLPDPPDVIYEVAQGKKINFDYLGTLSEAQKRLTKTRGIEAGLLFAQNLCNVAPQALDKINVDDLMEVGLKAYGFPNSSINDDETVKEIREIRAQQTEVAETVESLPKVAKAAASAGKAAEKGSPLMGLVDAMQQKAGGIPAQEQMG